MSIVENLIIAENGLSLGRLNPVDTDYTSVDHVEWNHVADESEVYAAGLWH
jgi:hypothetical protein